MKAHTNFEQAAAPMVIVFDDGMRGLLLLCSKTQK